MDITNPTDRTEPPAFVCPDPFNLDEPALGSYFVSTYPPFSCWTPDAVPAWRAVLEHAPESQPTLGPLGLYIHIPFCADRCSYCYYLSHDDRSGDIDRYLDALDAEAARLARAPALAGRRPSVVYVGGGTPSILSTPRLVRLLRSLTAAWPWTDAREVTFECAPRSVAEDKLRALRDAGVTRLSLGVQQLDDEVLRANGRIHLVRDVDRAWETIRRVDMDVVNVDLMVGLVGETDESFFRSLERTIGLGPESVTIYQLEIPPNTPLFRSLRDGRAQAAPATWRVKRARLGAAFQRLEEAGYTLRSGYTAVRDPVRHAFVYQDEQYRGADLIGLGTSAFSYLAGVHHQNQASLPSYIAAVRGGELPWGRAHALTAEERLVREFVLQLKLGVVSRASFRDRFAVDVADRFAEPIARAVAEGWLTVEADAIAPTRSGLLRIDRLLPAFYLTPHRGLRYS